ncbi:hypothetical protein ACIRUL_20730 [Streptomyces sp. NPDC101171]|uniref:hypothetical protein n=1 Tax=Streptomyces sp. NPDC101171 TaxID=3366122 RepID=UPI0038190EFB
MLVAVVAAVGEERVRPASGSGAIRTEWRGIVADQLEKYSATGAYSDEAEAVAAAMRSGNMTKRMSPPTVVADAIGKAVTGRRPRTRYATGFGARPLIGLRRLLSDRAFDPLVSRSMGPLADRTRKARNAAHPTTERRRQASMHGRSKLHGGQTRSGV